MAPDAGNRGARVKPVEWVERLISIEGDLYKQPQHWLVDDDGRVVVRVVEPQKNNSQDSVDLVIGEDWEKRRRFIDLEHAKVAAEQVAAMYVETVDTLKADLCVVQIEEEFF